jgi:hypothetical protein
MRDEDIVRAMEFGSLKLGQIGDRLHALVTLGGKKVILWVYWPLTPWLVQEVSHPLSKSESKSKSESESESDCANIELVRSTSRNHLLHHT